MTNVGLQMISRMVDKELMILNCRYLDDPTVATGLKLSITGAYIGQRKSFRVRTGHSTSRLVLIDAIRAIQTQGLFDIVLTSLFVPSEWRQLLQTGQSSYTMWLNVADEQDPSIICILQSNPTPKEPRGNLTWTIESNRTLIDSTLL